jgi:hypothetical protein
MATMAVDRIASRQASSRIFSVKGSPTCTVGFFFSLSASNASDAIDAPWMPSRPVRAPA